MNRFYSVCSIFLVIFILIITVDSHAVKGKHPVIENGVIDLRDWDFSNNEPLSLKGNWEFYWKSFLISSTERFDKTNKQYAYVPGYWNDIMIDGHKAGMTGFATYRLTILCPPNVPDLALRVMNIGTAFNMYANGKKIGSAGHAAMDKESAIPGYKSQICLIDHVDIHDVIVLSVEVSNYHEIHGGIWDPITIGLDTKIYELNEQKNISKFLLFGAILFMGMYHLILFVLRKIDLSPLYFSLICFLLDLRILLTDERYITNLFPTLSWSPLIKIEYLTFSVTVGVFFAFFRIIFPDGFNLRFYKFILVSSVIYTIIILFFPFMVFGSFLIPYEILTVIYILYALYLNAVAIKKNHPGAVAFFTGFVILFLAVINDILHQNQIIRSCFIVPFGFFALLFSQAIVISIRFSKAFESVEILEEKYRSIFENAVEGIYQYTYEGKLIKANPSLAKILGYEGPEELMASRDNVQENLFVDESQIKDIRTKLLDNGEIVNYEAQIYKKDRSVIWALFNIKAIYDSIGKIKHFEGMILDISEWKQVEEEIRKAKEAAESASNAKNQFIANMSHELRTPLNGLMGMLELLKGTSLDEEQKEYVHVIKTSSSILLTIVNDILDLSKIETGQFYIDKTNFNLLSTLENVHSILSVRASEKNIGFTFKIHPDIYCYLVGDEDRLKQILLNIAGNAIKFTDNGSVSIHLEPECGAGDVEKIRFIIKDTGIGISNNKIDQLFKYFSQGDISMNRKYGGTGLGLAISKHLVELMGGEIGVSSTLGIGSEFWFVIPFLKQACPEKTDENTGSSLEQNHDEPLEKFSAHILVVDDNAVNRKFAEAILKKLGHTVESVNDGDEAIAVLHEKTYDLILMDIQMPVMNGLETTKVIRDTNSGVLTHDIPIIAMTAHAMKGDMERCLEAGMDAYLTKPIRLDNLEKAIIQQLEKK